MLFRSRGTLGMGLAPVADQFERRNMVRVVDVQTRAVIDRPGVIRAVAATGHERDVGALDAALVVKPHFVVDAKIVSFTGDHHVVITVHAQFHGLSEFESRQRSTLTENAGIALFATKTTTHTTADHLHIIGGEIQCSGGFALIAIGVLRGAIQGELSIFTRHSVGDLTFQVKLFLLAGSDRTLNGVRGVGDCGGSVAPGDAFGGHDKAARLHGVFNREQRLEFLDLHLRLAGRLASVDHFARDHHGHGLTEKFDLAVGQERIVMNDGTAIVFARDVARGEHGHDAVLFQEGSSINALADQLAVKTTTWWT